MFVSHSRHSLSQGFLVRQPFKHHTGTQSPLLGSTQVFGVLYIQLVNGEEIMRKACCCCCLVAQWCLILLRPHEL